MADKKAHTGGFLDSMDFGKLLIIFLVVIFFMWLLTGGPDKENTKKPFITPLNDPHAAGEVYGPEDIDSNWGN